MTDLNKEALEAAVSAIENVVIEETSKRVVVGYVLNAYFAALPMGEPEAWIITDHTGCEHWEHDAAMAEAKQADIGEKPIIKLYTAEAFPPRPQEDALREMLSDAREELRAHDNSEWYATDGALYDRIDALLAEQERQS